MLRVPGAAERIALPSVEPFGASTILSSVAKKAIVFSCLECGNQANKWLGRCPECNAWKSYAEEQPREAAGRKTLNAAAAPGPIGAPGADLAPRLSTNLPSFDRALGRGVVLR